MNKFYVCGTINISDSSSIRNLAHEKNIDLECVFFESTSCEDGTTRFYVRFHNVQDFISFCDTVIQKNIVKNPNDDIWVISMLSSII